MESLLRNFAEENFGSGYYPLTHSSTVAAKPFGLMVKKKRYILWWPFRKYEYKILEGLEKYIQSGKEKKFRDALNDHIKKDPIDLMLEGHEAGGEGAASKLEFGVKAAKCVGAKIKIDEELGDLELGKIDQEYITDPDLRGILADTELNINMMKHLEHCKLCLITEVIYSERFEVSGKRKRECEVDAGVTLPIQRFAELKLHGKRKVIPSKIATRKTRGPFLLKCNRVVFDEETKQLKLAKGEIVGHAVQRDGDEEDKEDEECENTVIGGEESDLAEEESEKLERIITESVLIPTKNREERKARVKKYLQWFQEALSKDQKELILNGPLSDADREFLQSICVPALPDQTRVDLSDFQDEKIEGYAIVLKYIADMSDEEWDEVEKAWAESE